MLKAGGFRTPSRVQTHGFLTVGGAKMSKSRGTFVQASTYLKHADPDYLRFYYATKLSDSIEDIDLNVEDFVARVNADLVNNCVNLCSRVTKFLDKRFGGKVTEFDPYAYPVCAAIDDGLSAVRGLFAAWDYRGAVRRVAEIGDAVNQFFQDSEPWKLANTDMDEAQRVCSVALYGATVIMTALAPICPGLASRYAAAIGVPRLTFDIARPDWLPATVGAPDRLLDRIEGNPLQVVIDETRAMNAPPKNPMADHVVEVSEFKPAIEFDDFAKVDLRVGVVESAEFVEGAEKLLRLQVHCGKSIQVFAGVRKAYSDPSVLVGRRVVVVANLKPRKMKFGISEGMLLATSADDDSGLQLAVLDDAIKGGWTVR
jgi:methionyl-tRNA synthetase